MTIARHIAIPFLSLLGFIIAAAPGAVCKEFLTEKEIEMIQDTREIDRRVKIYLDAATLRLKSAEDRLVGKEPEPGDPLEFFTPEDMLDSYFRILKSVMMNVDEAAQKGGQDRALIPRALKNLKSSTEKADKQLQILKRIAENQKKEELWNLVNSALEITEGAHEGAVYGLSKQPSEKGNR